MRALPDPPPLAHATSPHRPAATRVRHRCRRRRPRGDPSAAPGRPRGRVLRGRSTASAATGTPTTSSCTSSPRATRRDTRATRCRPTTRCSRSRDQVRDYLHDFVAAERGRVGASGSGPESPRLRADRRRCRRLDRAHAATPPGGRHRRLRRRGRRQRPPPRAAPPADGRRLHRPLAAFGTVLQCRRPRRHPGARGRLGQLRMRPRRRHRGARLRDRHRRPARACVPAQDVLRPATQRTAGTAPRSRRDSPSGSRASWSACRWAPIASTRGSPSR